MKTAIVHEWLISFAGSEKVLEQIIRLYPEADLFTILDFLPESERGFILNKNVTTSLIQRLPFAKEHYRHYLALMPYAISRLDLSRYELIISSSHTAAKGVKKNPRQLHISYCHTPMRYIWDLQGQYLKETGLDKGLTSTILKLFFNHLRKWDVRTAKGVDYFIANSYYIKDRIDRVYQREASVIYPPVEIEGFTLNTRKEEFYLTVSRMVPYKRVDLIVEAFSEMGLPLIVIGDGPDFEKVRNRAGRNIEFMGYLRNDVLKTYMQKARAFVFAAEEDFGITPVEAQACGTPVIAFGRGGVQETVIPLPADGGASHNSLGNEATGIFYTEQTPASIIKAIQRFEKTEEKFDPYKIRQNAEKFSIERFRREFKRFVEEKAREFFALSPSRPSGRSSGPV